MKPRLVLVTGCVIVTTLLAGAPPTRAVPDSADSRQTPQGRWHFAVEGDPAFTYSILFSRTAAQDETRLLLRAGGSRLELVSRQSQGGSDSFESVRDATSRELFSRRLLLTGYQSVPGCEKVVSPDACILFEGANGRAEVSMVSLSGKDAVAVRARLAGLTSAELKGLLFEASACFGRVAELSSYQDDFLGLVWPERFRQQPVGKLGGTRGPGCAFDASFGYPCSEAELRQERIRHGVK